jgi:hypothetical protein
MKEIIKKVTNEILDTIDMPEYKFINCLEHQEFYKSKSSIDQYRLLSYISNLYSDIKILDIGTFKGCSALAFSSNKTNKIYSFNLYNQLDLNYKPNNVEFIVDNIINDDYDSLIKDSKVILLDTYHDGTFEKEFYDHITNLGFNGVLILDDIYLNLEMFNFWDSIKIEKIDMTNVGHKSGTGVVFFN